MTIVPQGEWDDPFGQRQLSGGVSGAGEGTFGLDDMEVIGGADENWLQGW